MRTIKKNLLKIDPINPAPYNQFKKLIKKVVPELDHFKANSPKFYMGFSPD